MKVKEKEKALPSTRREEMQIFDLEDTLKLQLPTNTEETPKLQLPTDPYD